MVAIRVLIVDDHAVLRDGIRSLLESYEDIAVVGEASNGREAVQLVAHLAPDVVLMDVAMPEMDGLEATRQIVAAHGSSRVLVLTQHDNQEYVFPILEAGAAGYLLKKVRGTELVSAIRAVHEGGSFLSPSITRAVIERSLRQRQPQEEAAGGVRLTEREKEVLKLVAEGLSNQEIADRLSLSIKTVMGHRANLMDKLNIHSRVDLVKYAIRAGLIEV
ncbi:MAG: response regulator [Chloroflexota bacterium]